MRIISGRYKGKVLASFKGDDIRPTADRVKESLFNIISFKIAGAKVLDAFCGSGSLGLECISRGAEWVRFNDFSKESIAVLKKNLTKIEGNCIISTGDFSHCLTAGEKYDIIFIDPPYASDAGINALKLIAANNCLNDGGIAIYERDRVFEGCIVGLKKSDERKYGKTYLTFFEVEK